MRLQGKVAVVTGAASGMGLAIATLFASEGASVAAGDWNGQRLDAAVANIKAAAGTIISAQGDISKKETAEGLVDLALSTYGRLDILVNNAGIMDYMQGIGEMTDEVWRKVMGVNLEGPMYCTRRAVQIMLQQGSGAIINVASTAALSGGAAGAAYTTSKHGLLGLSKNTAWTYAQKGIRCNVICPGATKTNIAESMPQDRIHQFGASRYMAFAQLTPGYLDPIDIANVALFLASDESRMINGAVVTADAGWMAL